jgi:hypothetical protein
MSQSTTTAGKEMPRSIALIIVMAMAALGLNGCKNSDGSSSTMKSNGSGNSAISPIYFSSWESYKIPFVPVGTISKDEALSRRSYYLGHYNKERQLERFEKYLNGKLEWQDEYTYSSSGVIKLRVMTKADGSKVIQHFDHRGTIVK